MTVQEIIELDWFEEVDLSASKVDKLTKSQLLELLKELNKIMIASAENWEGG